MLGVHSTPQVLIFEDPPKINVFRYKMILNKNQVLPFQDEKKRDLRPGWSSWGTDGRSWNMLILEQQQVFLWLFQVDDSKSLHKEWLFHQTSIKKWVFRVPGSTHQPPRSTGSFFRRSERNFGPWRLAATQRREPWLVILPYLEDRAPWLVSG